MKSFFQLATLALFFVGTSAHAQIVLQDFSNVADGVNNYFYGTWEATGDTGGSISPNTNFSQGAGVYDFAGSTSIIPNDGATSFVEFFNTTPVSIGTNGALSVTAQSLAGNASSSFTILLLDTNGNSAYAAFDAFSFTTGSYTTQSAPLTTIGAFDSALIDSLRISGNQPGGTAAFAVSFDNISAVSAVPEPSTYAAIVGALFLAFAVCCRRCTAATV